MLPVLDLDDLPQLPAGLARCRVGDTVVCGIGVDTAMARLSCATAAAEHLIVLNGGVPSWWAQDPGTPRAFDCADCSTRATLSPEATAVTQWALSPVPAAGTRR